MPEGRFTDRNAEAPTEVEIRAAERGLRDIASRIGALCVKRDSVDFGVAVDLGEGDRPICIYLRGEPSKPAQGSGDAKGVERFATWRDVAAAGWVVD